MCTAASISVDDYLASRQSGIAVWPTNDKLACRVYQIAGFAVKKPGYVLVVSLGYDTRHQNVLYVIAYALAHGLVGFQLVASEILFAEEFVVLGGNDYGIYVYGMALVIIFYCDLALCIGAQIGHATAFLADGRKCLHDVLCQVQRQRHVVVCLVCGITEHHALVACTLFLFRFTRYATIDVGTLFMHGVQYTAAFGIETIFRLGIAYSANGFASHQRNVDVGIRTHLAGNDDLTRCHHRFACNVRLVVISQQLVKNGIADLVCHLVGMAF